MASLDAAELVAVRGVLASFTSPTLIVWGDADEFFDPAWARWLATTLPGAGEPVAVQGGRLFFPFERPEALNRELRAF